jgi:cytochrome c oxidase subunit 3
MEVEVMVTTATSTERLTSKISGIGGGPGKVGPNGKGLPRNNRNGGEGDNSAHGFSPDRYRIAMWVVLAAITMMFTALTSAYIIRGASPDWRAIAMPRILYFSSALILASSVTYEIARRALKRHNDHAYNRWLLVTVLLGLGFLGSQLLAWRQLVAQGIYLATNPFSSFFYILTGAHGLHLLGGVVALDFLLLRTWRKRDESYAEARRQAIANAVGVYWHFMDGLWIYLFLLLLLWR